MAALEAQLEANPDDISLYRVYGDLLQSQGDPRGELIALQAELTRLGDIERASAALLKTHRDHLLGPLAAYMLEPESAIHIHWKLGFIESLSASPSAEAMDVEELADVLERTLAHPSGRFLRALHVFCAAPLDLAPVVAILVAAKKPASLRTIHLGEPDLLLTRKLASLPRIGEVEPLFAAFPGLEEVALGGRVRLGRIRAPHLLRFTMADCTAHAVDSLSQAEWPRLETLELAFAGDEAWTPAHLDTLARLLTSDRMPRLGSLHISGFPVELARQLVASDLVERLTTLALTCGSADNAAIEHLLERARTPGRLRHLDVSMNQLSADVVVALRQLSFHVVVSDPTPASSQQPVEDEPMSCSFCGKSHREVRVLVSGPRVFICDECIGLCQDIVEEHHMREHLDD